MGLTRCEFQGAGNEKATRSLKEAVLFYESFLDEVVAASEDELPSSSPGRRYDPARCSLDSLADWLEDATHSSAFSGIAAPETALLGFHHALQARLPKRKVALPKLLSFCEWNTECQAELETLACGIEQNTCIFTDIAQFFRPELYEVLEELKKKPSMAVEVLSPLLAAQSAMRRKAHCARHSKLCFIGTARMHTAGSSCTAHSKQGKQLGLADPNVLHLLAWIGLRLEVQEYEISLENVESFPSHILERLLGKYYVIESQDGVLQNEYERELQWASSRSLSMTHAFGDEKEAAASALDTIIKHYGVDRVSAAKDAIVSAGGPAKQPFLAALNVTEVEMRSKYSERFPAQACSQAGNSMNVICPYICVLHSAACWRAAAATDRIVAEVSLFRDACMQQQHAAHVAQQEHLAAAAEAARAVASLRAPEGERAYVLFPHMFWNCDAQPAVPKASQTLLCDCYVGWRNAGSPVRQILRLWLGPRALAASDEGSTGGTAGAMPSPRNTEKKRRFKAVSEPGAGDGKKSKSAKEAQSIEELFGEECVGALRIERIFEIFGEPKNEYVDIPWFDEDGKPNLIADPLNRPLQLSTVAEYEQRLFASGLADDCAGLPWLRWGKGAKARNYPLLCLSYNHRRQAFYNAYSRDPQHPMVQQALQHGLRRARVLGKDTPNFVVEWLCSEHNRHHQGSGETVCGLLGESLKVEASWKKRCALEGITARNPNYQKLYDAFVRTHSEAFKETVTAFGDAKSLAHTLEFYDVYSEFQDWHLAHGDFLCGFNPMSALSTMNAMANVIEDRAMMANIMTPMGESVTFKKLLKCKAEQEEDLAIEKKLEQEQTDQQQEGPGHSSGGEEDEEEEEKQPDVDEILHGLQSAKQAKREKKIAKKKKREASKKKAKADACRSEEQMPDKPNKGLDEAKEFIETISTRTKPPESRVKHALDDFLCALSFARSNLRASISDEEAVRTKKFLTSLFLELAWACSVAVNGKTFKTYYAFREECQRVFYAAHQKLHVGEKSYDPLVLAQELMSMVNEAARLSAAAEPNEETDGGKDEEAMLGYVRGFDVDPVKSFVESQLVLPESMHEKFSVFRRALGTRQRQFADIADLPTQLAFFHEVFAEVNAVPKAWVIYGSCVGFLLKQTGRFPDGAAAVFRSSDDILGRFCSARARYIILGLKDLVTMRVLKGAPAVFSLVASLASEVESIPPLDMTLMDGQGDIIPELAQQGDEGWSSKWSQLLTSCAAVSDVPKAARDLLGIQTQQKTQLSQSAPAAVPRGASAEKEHFAALAQSVKSAKFQDTAHVLPSHVFKLQDSGSGDAGGEDVDLESDAGQPEEDAEPESAFAALQKPLIVAKDLHSVFLSACSDDDGSRVREKNKLEKELGISMAAQWVKIVERSLESLLWGVLAESSAHTDKYVLFVADSAVSGIKDKVALVNAPAGLDLCYVGPVSTTMSSPQAKNIARIGGVDFFVHPAPTPPSGEVLVPAWLAKPTPKKENVTLKAEEVGMDAFVTSQGLVSISPPVAIETLRENTRELERQNEFLKSEVQKLSQQVAAAHAEKLNMAEQNPGQDKPANTQKAEAAKAAKSVEETAAAVDLARANESNESGVKPAQPTVPVPESAFEGVRQDPADVQSGSVAGQSKADKADMGAGEGKKGTSGEIVNKFATFRLTLHTLSTLEMETPSAAPVSLARAMTAAEVAAKASKQKKDTSAHGKAVSVGMAAAWEIRLHELEAKGEETAATKKKRKLEEKKGDKAAAMKAAKGAHLLK
ncbi:unnamed protein product [Effrenium voratum]|uniref:Uncharacterized protein n=1 Tax=Effrenium voratum TaxID=2562239 RepID=A0AA36IWN5_9DINO|nr:unnamed protein product [Effrenium voratum]